MVYLLPPPSSGPNTDSNPFEDKLDSFGASFFILRYRPTIHEWLLCGRTMLVTHSNSVFDKRVRHGKNTLKSYEYV